ncbi:MAG: UDP-N-acetylglucosamine 2-epimerase (non-hydrolyzing) [Flavobacteriales bacterium]|nr:UDP-N-acetylglucosamine 2-epimerase (non-hydrolyzing) [Flavobacteriales bacterium]
MKKIAIVIGTRPNFIKVTQMKKVGAELGIDVSIVHTGQHYDHNMATVFFDQFGLRPDHVLSLNERRPSQQLGENIVALANFFEELQPELVMVVGDVNSTLAGALAAQKAGFPISHLESGLRSLDRGMPEEINRILTDEITDHFFVTEASGAKHLLAEGKQEAAIHMVGNTMIDTMVAFEDEIDASSILDDLSLTAERYALMTFHRPALVDNEAGLKSLLQLLTEISQFRSIVLPLHPRTKKRMEDFGLWLSFEGLKEVHLIEPIGYFEFQKLIKCAKWVLTDSGGIQEETTFRQLPCITLRPNTERPITIDLGTNVLAEIDEVIGHVKSIEAGTFKSGEVPPMWDGQATRRVLEIIRSL